MNNILFIGSRGYLGKYIIDGNTKYNIIEFEGRVEELSNFEKYLNIKFAQIWHFGTPNNKDANLSSMISGLHNAINFANLKNIKLVYASSVESLKTTNINIYGKIKKQSNVIITNSCNKYMILMIPRVYSLDRNDGLIGAIKENKKLDLDKVMMYLHISEFVKQFYNAITQNKIYHFKHLLKKKIYKIREWVL